MTAPPRRRRQQSDDKTRDTVASPPPEPAAEPGKGEDEHDFAQRQSRELQSWVNAAEPTAHDREQNFLLTPEQKARLRKQLPASLIGTIEKEDGEQISFVPAHVVDLLAMTIFGDQWSSQVMEVRELYQGPNSKPTMQQTHLLVRHAARVRVTVTGPDGTTQSHEAGAVCSCAARIGDMEEMDEAWQTSYQGAITLARRNAISLFGEIFGGILMRDRDGIVAAARRNRQARQEAERKQQEIPPHAPADAQPAGPTRTVSRPGNNRQSAKQAATTPARTVHTAQLYAEKTDRPVANQSAPAEGTHQLVRPDGTDLGRMTPSVFETTFIQLLDEVQNADDAVEIAGANDDAISALPDAIRQRLEQAVDNRVLQLQGASEEPETSAEAETQPGTADDTAEAANASDAATTQTEAAPAAGTPDARSDDRPDPETRKNAYQSWILRRIAGCTSAAQVDTLMSEEKAAIDSLFKTGQKVIRRCADSRREELAEQTDG